MKTAIRPTVVALILFLAIGAFALLPHRPTAEHELVPFRKDFILARAEAQRLHKPILLDFMATWCGPCQEMSATTWSDPKVAAELQNWIPVQIDIDQSRELATRFSINAVPTLVLLDEQGTVITFSEGAMSSEQFLEWLHAASKK